MSADTGLYRDNKHLFGERVDAPCPYDEAQLRVSKELPGRLICPCCWTTFIDVKAERHAFEIWWVSWCPDRDMPSITSHIFDAWLASARYRLAALTEHPAGIAAKVDVRDRFWLVLQEPGRVPERKGPWRKDRLAYTIREFMVARPTAYIHVLTIDSLGEPEVEHAPETLQILDGRSMGTGRKHNARTRAAHAAHHASPEPPSDECEADIELPEAARDLLRAMHQDQRTVGYRLDLWNCLEACLTQAPKRDEASQ